VVGTISWPSSRAVLPHLSSPKGTPNSPRNFYNYYTPPLQRLRGRHNGFRRSSRRPNQLGNGSHYRNEQTDRHRQSHRAIDHVLQARVLRPVHSLPRRNQLDEQDHVQIRRRQRQTGRDRHVMGVEQADRGSHHLCFGRWCRLAGSRTHQTLPARTGGQDEEVPRRRQERRSVLVLAFRK
jgi:hypothetical protein